MSHIEKSKNTLPAGGGSLTSGIGQSAGLSAGLAAAFAGIELPRQFNQLVVFVLDGSGSMTHEGSSGKSKGHEVHQAVVQVLERLKKSKNVASFDIGFIAYAEETVEMFPVRAVKDCDLVQDCYNPCEHIKEYNRTFLKDALELAGQYAQDYLSKHANGITKSLILLLSDGVINDHNEAVDIKKLYADNDQVHFATIFFESPNYEKLFGINQAEISKRFSQFASAESDHASTVDPEVIRAHMIKSITKVSKIDPHTI